MKYFISFMFLITSVNAFAVSVPSFKTPCQQMDAALNKCQASISKANEKCFGVSSIADEQATQKVNDMSAQMKSLSIRAGSDTLRETNRAKLDANLVTLKACSAALNDCNESCIEIANPPSGNAEGGSPQECVSENQTVAKNTINSCKTQFGGMAKLAMGDVSQALAVDPKAKATGVASAGDGSTPPTNPQEETWFQRNGAYVVGAGMLGVAGMALLSNSGSKSGSQQQQQNSSPSQSSSPTTTTTACTSDSDYNNSACTDTLVTSCASATSNLCAAFTNNYCGLDDANDVTPSGSGAGNKTTFCRSKVSARFCATGNSTCATCEYLTQQSKDICKTNPTLCVAQNTPEQIAAKQAACPSDPLYADASILQGYGSNVDGSLDQPNLPSGTTSTLVSTNPSTTSNSIGTTTGSTAGSTTPTTSKNTATGTTVFTGKYNSSLSASNSSSKPGITSASATPASVTNRKPAGSSETFSGGQGAYATASAYRGAASEVSDSLGRNLFDKNSKTLNIWCKSVSCQSVAARSVTN